MGIATRYIVTSDYGFPQMRAKTRAHGIVLTPATAQATLSTTAPTVTVGQIADALQNIEPDTRALTERIRSWTKQRILLPINNVGAGTGRHAEYARDARYEAALLNALSRTGYVVGKPYVGTALERLREMLPDWRLGKSLFLVITHPIAGGEPKAGIVTKIAPDSLKAEATIIINLSELFARVRVI